MKKKLCSILLALTMVLTLLPVSALADDGAPAEAEQVAAELPSATDGVVTLASDTSIPAAKLQSAIADGLEINLNGKTLTITSAGTVTVPEGKTVKFYNGTILNSTFTRGDLAAFAADKDATLIVDNVTMNTTGSAFFPAGNASAVTVTNSRITAGVYVIGTNASGNLSDNVRITLKDSTLTSTCYQNNDRDTCTVMINVPGTMNIDNCKIYGGRQVLFVRCGTATVNNSTITLSSAYNDTGKYDNKVWGSGNEVPMGAVVVGNRANGAAYDTPATCTLNNTTVTGGRVYTYQKDAISVKLNITGNSTINGAFVNGDGEKGKATIVTESGTYSDLANAVAYAADGATIKLAADLDLANTLIVTKKLTLDLEGHTIYNTKDIRNNADGVKHWSLISVRDNGDLTITGNGKLKTKENDCYAVDLYDTTAKCTIENGEYVGNISVVYVLEGQLTIKDGSFSIQQLNTNGVQDGYNLLLNCLDENYKNGTASITVTGGTYIKFNPKDCTAEGKDTSFVPDGYCAKHDETADTYTIAAHTWNAGVVTAYPTYTEVGTMTYTCTNCNATKTEDIAKLVYVPVTPNNNNNSSSTTTKNPDGSTTTTTTDKATGAVTETTTTANGSVGTVKTDANGSTEISASISAADVKAAEQKNAPVIAPITVTPAASSAAAPIIKLSVPANAGEVAVAIPVVNAKQGTVAVKVNPDGTEEIIKTAVITENGLVLGVKGSMQIKVINNSKNFADTVGHWAASDVDFVSARELFNGTAPALFSPEASMTRGMVVTVIARLAGENTDGGANWYDKGCAWAVANGVSDGTDPNGSITREQLAAMLYRYCGSPAASGSLSAYADSASVSAFASDAMQWCVNNGIINGMDGLLNPQGQATRAQVSAMFARYIRLAAAK